MMAVIIDDQVNEVIHQLTSKSKTVSEEDIDIFVYQKLNIINSVMDRENATKEELDLICKRVKGRIAHTIYRTNTVIKDSHFEPWFAVRKGSLKLRYWDRYRKYLELQKHFNINVINTIDDVVDEIIDLVGDPTVDGKYQRRGLVIGDVQSGKTSNFIGLMCKACDVGYKIIVLLAGISNELRKQTQGRVDEGLIGLDSNTRLEKNEYNRIGAALYCDEDLRPICVTSENKDFNKSIASQLNLSLNQTSVPIVFVIKKNVSVLDNLNTWIRELNQTNDQGLIDAPLLVIDDEADYASINTNKPDEDPTKTNQKITELLSLFTKTSYIGFTATPYANVFIDPETTDDMLTNPLFPKDFIYCLDSPTNYVGARDLFGDEDDPSIKTIEPPLEDEDIDLYNINYILPLKHKKDNDFERLPKSLKEAILTFFLANAIRDLRHDTHSHRSMLINISRFVNVHAKIKDVVESYVKRLKRSIMHSSRLMYDEWTNDSDMMDLFNVYKKEYRSICEDKTYANSHDFPVISWTEIRNQLYTSVAPIVVRIVNAQSKDDMSYKAHQDNGLRVIAIGGIALSRGLTLEGLTVSYFYRTSNAYDTLMQMGRWFGYKDGYRDICRIWLTDDMQEAYYAINQATEELRDSIIQYKNSGLTPMDFGIQVRTNNNLIITARNKMRSAKEALIECTLSSKIIETKYLLSDDSVLEHNYKITMQFINKLESDNEEYHYDREISTSVGYKNVSYSKVIGYLNQFIIADANVDFEKAAITNFIKDNVYTLRNWDIAFIPGDGSEFVINNKHHASIKCPTRAIDLKSNTNLIRVSGKKTRLGGPGDGKFGLKPIDIEKVKKFTEEKKNASQVDYFKYPNTRNPLLAIYMMECRKAAQFDDNLHYNEDVIDRLCERSKSHQIVGISIGIPNLGKDEEKVRFALNKVAQGLRSRNIELDEDYYDEE